MSRILFLCSLFLVLSSLASFQARAAEPATPESELPADEPVENVPPVQTGWVVIDKGTFVPVGFDVDALTASQECHDDALILAEAHAINCCEPLPEELENAKPSDAQYLGRCKPDAAYNPSAPKRSFSTDYLARDCYQLAKEELFPTGYSLVTARETKALVGSGWEAARNISRAMLGK